MQGRLAAVVALVVGVGLAIPAGAGAHALLLRTTPTDGVRLQDGPRVIHLVFNEDISPRFRSAQLVGSDGRKVAGTRQRPGGSGHELVLTVPRLPRGAYGVVWHVVSEDDGHATSGTLFFGVRIAAPQGSAQATPAPPVDDVSLRWLRFSLTALLVGGLAFVVLVLPFARPWLDPQLVRRAARRVLAASIAGGVGALFVELVVLVRQTSAVASAAGTPWTSTLRNLTLVSRWGALWLAGDAILACLLVLSLRLRDRAPIVPAPAAAAVALSAAAYAGVTALGTHAAGLPHAGPAVAADAVHVLFASIWLGGLAALGVALAPVRGMRSVDAHVLATAVRRPFAALAGTGLFVLVVTGLYSAGVQVASVDALLTTLYGQTLLAKAGLVAVCCALGGANFLALRRGRALRVTLFAEAAAGALALLGAAVLTASAPARGPQFGSPRAVHAPTLAAEASDVVLSVTVKPNRPGLNLVSVVAASSQRPAPAPLLSVAVGNAKLRHVGGDRWVGPVRLDAPGDASLPIRIHRAGSELSSRIAWRIDPPDPAGPVRFSSRRLATLVDPAAALLLAALAAAAAAVLLFRKRSALAPLHRLPREEHA